MVVPWMAAVLVWAAPASAAGFLAGASVVVTTPPLTTDAAATKAANDTFAAEFSRCPAGLGTTLGNWALQEPFVDLNGNKIWDDQPPEPYCDANGNGRWDGMYTSGGTGDQATGFRDDIEVRAFAISNGGKPVVIASVVQQGIFDFYTDQMRAQLPDALKKYAPHYSGPVPDLVVSANHNESSPDSVGIYGAGQTGLGAGVRSGIDEYFMRYLEAKVAQAAAEAVDSLQPAALYANQQTRPDLFAPPNPDTQLPHDAKVSIHLSRQFPTTVAKTNDDRTAAIDPKLGVLQARDASGKPIFTVMSLAAHNQEMGHANGTGTRHDFSSDWPGYFARTYDAAHGGVSMFLVGDNGSEEDPQSEPATGGGSESDGHTQAQQAVQAQQTGERFASIVSSLADTAVPLAPGAVSLHRQAFCVPLENNAFLALDQAGVFGMRQAYVCTPDGTPVAGAPSGSQQFRTFVSYTDIGPDLQLIANPGEAFPALMLGSPFGKEEESCDRPNPGVPTWHADAPFRFQVGLADDLIGYMIPAWGYYEPQAGVFPTQCTGTPGDDGRDPAGHKHKLETEGVGYTASNSVADHLVGLLDGHKDASARVGNGRYVLDGGTFSHWPTGAVGIMLPAAGATKLDAMSGTLVGAPDVAGVGGRAVDQTGVFMDYDGQPQAAPDITTRGMVVFAANGCVSRRYYVSVFDPLSGTGLGGAASRGQPATVNQNCAHSDGTQDDTNGGSGGGTAGTGSGSSGGGGGAGGTSGSGGAGNGARSGCIDRRRPTLRLGTHPAHVHRGRLTLHGQAGDRGCGKAAGRVQRVTLSIGKRGTKRSRASRCRFIAPGGRVTAPRSCAKPVLLLAKGTRAWRLSVKLPAGRWVARVRAIDAAGNASRTRSVAVHA